MQRFKFEFFAKILIIAICILANNSLWAQNSRVTSIIDSNFVEFGNPVQFTISVNNIKGVKSVEFPQFKNNIIVPELEVVGGPFLDTIFNPDLTINVINKYLITSFSDSTFTIPQLKVKVDNNTYVTDSISVTFTMFQNIDSTFLDEIDTNQVLKIFDIVPVKETPLTFEEFWARFGHIIIIVLVVAILTAIITYMIVRKLRNKPIIPISKPKEPADIVAIRELNNLNSKQLWQSNKIKQYYSELTDIIKVYISDRYGVSIIELTSDESLYILKRFISKDSKEYNNIKYIFETADLVKFAKMIPNEIDNQDCISFAYDFVDKTKLIAKEVDEKTNNQ